MHGQVWNDPWESVTVRRTSFSQAYLKVANDLEHVIHIFEIEGSPFGSLLR